MTLSVISPSKLIENAASHDKPIEEDKNQPDLEISLEDYRQRYQINNLAQQLKENKENHDLRTKYANKIFWLVCVWLSCVIFGLLLSGFSESTGFIISDRVLITFIVTTTLNVLGLFVIVAKWMFQQNTYHPKVKK
ncbi:hypothetical protein [Nitrosomonas supralitoralis]|uniref:Uncharacterized protein n=1 Tax=Nitrosomonas supralitoralis TaxID=2116706 RepID=A0A2P7NR11_9PROT|nr:hypothetical protein [Nitrosomonas supralitoralis]PSJ15926.1 hypothetical protein C7H79_16335 [Nitrosomonas supralitoralis]